MRLKTILIASVLVLGFLVQASAQGMKIGFANIEALLVYMPETKTMNQQLATYQKKLGEALQRDQQVLQDKYNKYVEAAQKESPDQAALKAQEEELKALDEAVKKKANDSDQKLMTKRQDLLEPIIEKMQTAIKALAAEENYDYILNTVDGSGVSIVLHGPEGNDVTMKLAAKLGVKIPEASESN